MKEIPKTQDEEKIKEFNEIFDTGENFDKAIASLNKANPLIEEELKRLKRNIESYYRTYSDIEKMQKNRSNYNFTGKDFEESDRKRKIYHNGIIDSLKRIAKMDEKTKYFAEIFSQDREDIGKWALNLTKYFNLKKKKEAA